MKWPVRPAGEVDTDRQAAKGPQRPEKAVVTYNNGGLEITMPAAKRSQPKRIEVREAGIVTLFPSVDGARASLPHRSLASPMCSSELCGDDRDPGPCAVLDIQL